MSAKPTIERRSGNDRRKSHDWLDASQPEQRKPSWPEQRMQFITRYLLALIGLIYFGLSPERAPLFVSLATLNVFLAIYCLYNTYNFYWAYRHQDSSDRRRIFMWVDIGVVTACLSIDPNTVPVSMLAYVLIIMGNGMRYGMTLFRESITAAFALCALALGTRYSVAELPVTAGMTFLVAFAAFIVVYCYALMERISASQRELVKHSRYDPLTGLLNRRGLYESAELILQLLSRSNHHLTVIFADMDRFKLVNDTKGHAEGDRILRTVGRMLTRVVRNSDLVARYGGDEFVLILPEATAEQASRVTTSLRRQIQELVEETGIPFGVSFGVKQVAACSTNIHDLLVEVDRDMYRAKRNTKTQQRDLETPLSRSLCNETPST